MHPHGPHVTGMYEPTHHVFDWNYNWGNLHRRDGVGKGPQVGNIHGREGRMAFFKNDRSGSKELLLLTATVGSYGSTFTTQANASQAATIPQPKHIQNKWAGRLLQCKSWHNLHLTEGVYGSYGTLHCFQCSSDCHNCNLVSVNASSVSPNTITPEFWKWLFWA